MGAHGIDGIDHLVIAVRDLDRARDTYAKLGFTVTPRGRHTELKSINHTLMFGADDYVELLGVEEPHPVTAGYTEFLKTREGIASVALKTADARDAQRQLSAAGLTLAEAVDFGRPVDLPEGKRDARFTITPIDRDRTPGGAAFLCQHHTRDVVWRPEHVTHANGAKGLAALLVAADDPDPAASAWAQLFGTPVESHHSARIVRTGDTPIIVMTPAALRLVWADDAVLAAPRPLLAGMVVRVGDIYAAQQLLQKAKFQAMLGEGILRVGSPNANGVLLAFTESLDLHRLIPR